MATTTETERVAVPDRIVPATIPEESALEIERVNYAKARELIAAGERWRVENALGRARDLPADTERLRAMWAHDNNGKWTNVTMPADLLADFEARLGRLPYQLRGIEAALAD